VKIFLFNLGPKFKLIKSLFTFAVIICTAAVSIPTVNKTVVANAQADTTLTVIIDAGHGGLTNTTD
jgi:N-acetylmuramoyl-L-alanine amidase